MSDDKELIEKERELFTYDGEYKIISSYDMRKMIEDQNIPTIEYKTGFGKIDRMTCGFRHGQVIVISGRPGEGKTLLCQTITENLQGQEKNCLWFSYEVSPREFLNRFKGVLPLFFLPKMMIDKKISWIEERIIESIVKYETRVVFIDHLHYLIPMNKVQNSSLVIGGIIRELKLMANKHNVIIFLIAHVEKVKKTEGLELENIRDSSFVAQEADHVIFIWRKREESLSNKEQYDYTNYAVLYLAKNRWTGKLGYCDIMYIENKFVEVTKNYG